MANDTFHTIVLPVMEKVKREIQTRQADELTKHQSGLSYLLAAAAGPDGGMAAMQSHTDNLRWTGEWNSKTSEDYVNMVRTELQKKNIQVTPEMEKQIIDQMIQDQVPRSTLDYLLRKSTGDSIFATAARVKESPLDRQIRTQAEQRYAPSWKETMAANVTTGMINYMGMGGPTAGYVSALGSLAADMMPAAAAPYTQQTDFMQEKREKATQEVRKAYQQDGIRPTQAQMRQFGFTTIEEATPEQLQTAIKKATQLASTYSQKIDSSLGMGLTTVQTPSKPPKSIPLAQAAVRVRQYELLAQDCSQELTHRTQAQQEENSTKKGKIQEAATPAPSPAPQVQEQPKLAQQETTSVQTSPSDGWATVAQNLGLQDAGKTMGNLGFNLAMLPDVLLGALSGKSSNLGMNSGTLMPLAAIIAGFAVKNPLLKLMLIMGGGMNLLGKASQDAQKLQAPAMQPVQRFKVYAPEPLNSRIQDPRIENGHFIADFDRIPTTVQLTPNQIAAWQQGALPLSTLANAILERSDTQRQQQKLAQENYEQNQSRENSRGIR